MNNWDHEYMAEYHRQDILEEAEQIRLEKSAYLLKHRSRLFGRIMIGIGNWMIEKGTHICWQYKIHPVDE